MRYLVIDGRLAPIDSRVEAFLEELQGGDVFSALALADYLEDSYNPLAGRVRPLAQQLQATESWLDAFTLIADLQCLFAPPEPQEMEKQDHDPEPDSRAGA